MSMWSAQWIFCNACGLRFLAEWSRVIGRESKVCSIECLRRVELLRARSILGEPDAEGFRESAAMWFAGRGSEIRNELHLRAHHERREETEARWLADLVDQTGPRGGEKDPTG